MQCNKKRRTQQTTSDNKEINKKPIKMHELGQLHADHVTIVNSLVAQLNRRAALQVRVNKRRAKTSDEYGSVLNSNCCQFQCLFLVAVFTQASLFLISLSLSTHNFDQCILFNPDKLRKSVAPKAINFFRESKVEINEDDEKSDNSTIRGCQRIINCLGHALHMNTSCGIEQRETGSDNQCANSIELAENTM